MPRTSTKPAAPVKRLAPDYRLEDQIGFLLRRAYQRASSNLVEQIGSHDLTAPQFATLARLYERGALSQNLLGRLVAMEPANIRDVVLRLKKRRLVATRRDPTDKRLVLIDLTATGVALVEQLIPIEIACTAKTLAPLDAEQKRLLYDLLGRLAEN
ncbi:MarR family transcriptional regulator [Bradyrhizobium sp. Arg68]|uniref:MarR family winged helix-turn-helix transcriptional regulator n=1 Tax=Bradyrhizobium ivorense TaxID=2511166 RepID=UPI001E52E0DD|nr:MarR family transcriptional regulator [Bradyrhizobium ivorense]MCC8942464.1 MarR family transcriptional regulator [Bradyrhizobium ivorense]